MLPASDRSHNSTPRRARLRRSGFIVLLVINLLLVPLVLISGYGGMVNPETSALPGILSMTYPFWALLEVVMLIVTLFVSWRMALIPAVVLLLSLSAIWNICPLNIPHGRLSDSERQRAFTVMTYNVIGFHDQHPEDANGCTNRTTYNIINSGADIVCMMEAYGVFPRPHVDISQELVDSVRAIYPHAIHGGGNDDVCIYSAYPIRKVDIPPMGGICERWLAGVADIDGHHVLIVAVHLESIGLSNDDREAYNNLASGDAEHGQVGTYRDIARKLKHALLARARQAQQLRGVIDSLRYENVIVAGDFNDISGCYAIRCLMGDDMRDAYRVAGFGPMTTYNAQHFLFHIDQVLYRGDFKAVRYWRGDVPSSDHYPVFTTFLFNDPAR